MKRLIRQYPPNRRVDRVVNNVGEDFSHEGAHNMSDAENDDDEDDADNSSENSDVDDAPQSRKMMTQQSLMVMM